MYRVSQIIENDKAHSFVDEVSFHPSGAYFAASYEHLNEVRIFDSRTKNLLQVLTNPVSELNHPHGLLFTEKYLLISNALDRKKPGKINVYRIGSAVAKPIQTFESPLDHLHEPHSMTLRGGRLVVTYCENLAPSGAIVSYGFDEESGKITGLLDKTESWFSAYGDAKGICFNADGSKVYVTFESDKPVSVLGKIFRSFASDRNLPASAQVFNFSRKVVGKVKKSISQRREAVNNALRETGSEIALGYENPNPQYATPTKNGIAVFSIDTEGKIGRHPQQLSLYDEFCRLENIDVFDDICVVTDLVNRFLLLYDLTRDPMLTNPQRISLGNATPHGAAFSPDGKLLLVSSLGIKVANQEPLFFDWEVPREDKIIILERAI